MELQESAEKNNDAAMEQDVDEYINPNASATSTAEAQLDYQKFVNHASLNASNYEFIPWAASLHPSGIYSLATTQNAKWIFSGGADGEIRKFDTMATLNGKTNLTAAQKATLPDTTTKAGVLLSSWENVDEPAANVREVSPVYSLAVQSQGIWCLSGCLSGAINLYSIRHDEGRCHDVLRHHKHAVSCMSLSGDERQVVTGSWDKSVVVWELDKGEAITEFCGDNYHPSQISSVSFQPGTSATQILASSIDGNVTVSDLRANNPLINRLGMKEKTPRWCMSATWSPDGSCVYIGRRNATVDVIDMRMSDRVNTLLKLPSTSGEVNGILALPDNKTLLIASRDNVRCWYTREKVGEDVSPFAIVPGGPNVTSMVLASGILCTAAGDRGWGTTDVQGHLMFYEERAW